jgi:biopolymer transport protein ExbD
MHFAKRKHRRAPSVIIVSLIDVLLVVLIFLMVTTTFKKMEPSLKLTLPQASEAKIGAVESDAFIILVSSNFPHFYLENLPVTENQLQKALTAAATQDSNLRVDIRADAAAPYGEVIKVINAAQAAGVGSINTITEKSGRP